MKTNREIKQALIESDAYLSGFNDGVEKERERLLAVLDQRIAELEEARDVVNEEFSMPHGEARLDRTIYELERVRDQLTAEGDL